MPVVGYACHLCHDQGWFYKDVAPGNPDFGKAFPCECREQVNAERRRNYLFSIDGLSPEDRFLRFEDFVITDENREAYFAVTDALTRHRGMVTLTGPWGVGKSNLLISAINKAREAGMAAVYATTAQLFDYLRRAYKPGEEIDIDQRWDLLVGADVLAIDELEKFAATPWALERFSRLIDERWHAMSGRLTLLATNAKVEQLPGDVTSRLEDGRAKIVTITGTDMRKFNEWGDAS